MIMKSNVITNEELKPFLCDIVRNRGTTIVDIPGVREALTNHFRSEIVDQWYATYKSKHYQYQVETIQNMYFYAVCSLLESYRRILRYHEFVLPGNVVFNNYDLGCMWEIRVLQNNGSDDPVYVQVFLDAVDPHDNEPLGVTFYLRVASEDGEHSTTHTDDTKYVNAFDPSAVTTNYQSHIAQMTSERILSRVKSAFASMNQEE